MKMSETLQSDEHSEEVESSSGDINYTSDGANNDIKVLKDLLCYEMQ